MVSSNYVGLSNDDNRDITTCNHCNCLTGPLQNGLIFTVSLYKSITWFIINVLRLNQSCKWFNGKTRVTMMSERMNYCTHIRTINMYYTTTVDTQSDTT